MKNNAIHSSSIENLLEEKFELVLFMIDIQKQNIMASNKITVYQNENTNIEKDRVISNFITFCTFVLSLFFVHCIVN